MDKATVVAFCIRCDMKYSTVVHAARRKLLGLEIMSRTLAIVMGFALLGFCSAQNCTFLDGECSVSVKYMASLKTTNNDIDM
jgi:hypothetical protein